MSSSGRELHALAAQAREDEHYTESLTYNDDALFAYDSDNDSLGFSEGIACRSITLRVYANLHDSTRILILAKYEMLAAVELAKQSGNVESLALPLYNLAQIQEDLGELKDSISTYHEAIVNMEKNPPENHNRSSVIANMKLHQATCEYRAGDTTALDRAETALQELENAEEPNTYTKEVWVSGGYMRIAHAIKEDNKEKAMSYLEKAKKIIDANPKLVLRKQQWEKLSSQITH